jgi:hypothetical protein
METESQDAPIARDILVRLSTPPDLPLSGEEKTVAH